MKFATIRLILTSICALMISTTSALAEDAGWHHVHLGATDPVEAAAWYAEHMEGEAKKFAGVMPGAQFGNTVLIFMRKRGEFGGSEGSAVDHIGWSFEDLDARMAQWKEAGVKVLAEPRQFGKVKFGFVEDPWGTKIEVMQDPDLYGFHHVHLISPDPTETIDWYAKTFGGEAKRFFVLPALKIDGIWLICTPSDGDPTPTSGRSLDHIGFSFPDLDSAVETMKADGVNITLPPTKLGALKISFLVSPEGARIELVESEAPAAAAADESDEAEEVANPEDSGDDDTDDE